jgi:hypothetical protein
MPSSGFETARCGDIVVCLFPRGVSCVCLNHEISHGVTETTRFCQLGPKYENGPSRRKRRVYPQDPFGLSLDAYKVCHQKNGYGKSNSYGNYDSEQWRQKNTPCMTKNIAENFSPD